MTARRLTAAAAGLAALLLAFVVLPGGDDAYRLKLKMPNAYGLVDGSAVVVSGVRAGEVSSIELAPGKGVIAEVKLDEAQAPVGRDVVAAVRAKNLLGAKQIEILKGDVSKPAPSGFVIDDVTPTTDLDQVLSVLDVDTRARLTILINEAGAAFAGRRLDVRKFLEELPESVVDARVLLERMVQDNKTLGQLLGRSHRFVAQVSDERRSLGKLVRTIGEAADTGAVRQAEIRATLAKAPGTLRTLQGFLGELRATTVPLGPAARELAKTATPLNTTLAELEPFRRAADPALRTAGKVAPQLTRLADGTTPVLKRAVPTVAALAGLGRELVPVSSTLDRSADNLVATVENWSRAIQFRDGLSHVFRGEASVSPEALRSLLDVDELPSPTKRKSTKQPTAPSAPPPAATRPSTPKTPVPEQTLKELQQALRDLLGGALDRPGTPGIDAPSPLPDRDSALLDYLLG